MTRHRSLHEVRVPQGAASHLITVTPEALERIIGQRLAQHHEEHEPNEHAQIETIDMLSRSKAPLVPASPHLPPAELRLARTRNSASSAQTAALNSRLAFQRDRGATSGNEFHSGHILSLSHRRATFNGNEMSACTELASAGFVSGQAIAAGSGRLPLRGSELSLSTPSIHTAASHDGDHASRPPALHLPPTAVRQHSGSGTEPDALLLGSTQHGANGVRAPTGRLSTIRDSQRGIIISRDNSRKGIDVGSPPVTVTPPPPPAPTKLDASRFWRPKLHSAPVDDGDAAAKAAAASAKGPLVLPIPPSRSRSFAEQHAKAPPEPSWLRTGRNIMDMLQGMILHPYSTIRLRWERIIFLAVMATVVEAPFYAAFLEHDSTGASVLTILIDLLIGADVYVNLLTGYVSDDANAVEMHLLPIAKHYAKSWLLLDMIAAWPVRIVALIVTRNCDSCYSFTTIVRVGRLARCLKVPLVMRTLRRGTSSRNSLLAVVLTYYFIVMHWFTCLQWALPRAQGYPEESWPVVTETIKEDKTRRYIQTAFNTISQMASIGYGNYQPTTTQELITTVFNIVMGNASFGLLVSAFAVKLSSTDSCTRAHDERLEAVNHYLALTAMPVELRQRVRAHMLTQFPTNKLYDEHQVLGMLPFQLRRDLNLVRARTLYQKVPLFRVGGTAFMVQVSQQLHPQHALPGEYLLHEGEPIVYVSFIDEGSVEILVGPDLSLIAELHSGDFLGEAACVRDRVYAITTARVLTQSIIFVIRGSALREVLARFPDVKLAVMHVINSRLDVLDRHRPHKFNKAHVPQAVLHGGQVKVKAVPKQSTQQAAPVVLPPQPPSRHHRSASFS